MFFVFPIFLKVTRKFKSLFIFEEKKMSDLHTLQIIGIIVIGHIILGFAWIIYKIYKKGGKD